MEMVNVLAWSMVVFGVMLLIVIMFAVIYIIAKSFNEWSNEVATAARNARWYPLFRRIQAREKRKQAKVKNEDQVQIYPPDYY